MILCYSIDTVLFQLKLLEKSIVVTEFLSTWFKALQWTDAEIRELVLLCAQ